MKIGILAGEANLPNSSDHTGGDQLRGRFEGGFDPTERQCEQGQQGEEQREIKESWRRPLCGQHSPDENWR